MRDACALRMRAHLHRARSVTRAVIAMSKQKQMLQVLLLSRLDCAVISATGCSKRDHCCHYMQGCRLWELEQRFCLAHMQLVYLQPWTHGGTCQTRRTFEYCILVRLQQGLRLHTSGAQRLAD